MLTNTKGMTLVEVLVSFVIIAIASIVFVMSFTTIGRINAHSAQQESDDAGLVLDIESAGHVRVSDISPESRHIIISGIYTMDVTVTDYTAENGTDTIEIFEYVPSDE